MSCNRNRKFVLPIHNPKWPDVTLTEGRSRSINCHHFKLLDRARVPNYVHQVSRTSVVWYLRNRISKVFLPYMDMVDILVTWPRHYEQRVVYRHDRDFICNLAPIGFVVSEKMSFGNVCMLKREKRVGTIISPFYVFFPTFWIFKIHFQDIKGPMNNFIS